MMTSRATLVLKFVATLLALSAYQAFGYEVGLGVVGIEEGDDRLRPAANLHIGYNANWMSRLYVYGRDFGPVRERSYLFSVNRAFDVIPKTFRGMVGGVVMQDTTSLKYKDAPAEDSTYTSTNFGISFGAHWNLYEVKSMKLYATWDSHVFPAGSGFIALANARKSAVGLSVVTSW